MPVFEYGCDSSYSWSSKFKHLARDWTVEELVNELHRLGYERFGMVNGWYNERTKQVIQLCFTGGEPMLQQRAMEQILKRINEETKYPPHIVTIETNGTKKLVENFKEFLKTRNFKLNIACSPKLFSVSGEKNAIHIDVIEEYMKFSDSGIIKFVVNGTKKCWDEIEAYMDVLVDLTDRHSHWSIWAMPVGATKEQQELPSVAEIANEAMRRGFFVATRNHTYVYGNVVGS